MREREKAEGRSPKAERRPKSEGRSGRTTAGAPAGFGWLRLASKSLQAYQRRRSRQADSLRPSDFCLLSAFGLRTSDFCRPAVLSHALGLALFALVLLTVPSSAAASLPAFEAANKLYEEGKFADAAAAYEKLVQSGEVSEPLYFNLGNAWFKSGQIGRAIAAYRKAERIAPRDPDVRANLRFARNQTPPPTRLPSRWQRWLGHLTLNEWTVLAAGALWLWLLLLALRQWRPPLRPSLRVYVPLLAVVAALLCGCVVAALRDARFVRTAIVIAPEAAARFTPLPESATAFTLHDGAELRILDQKDDWLQVNAGPGKTAWVRRDQVLLP